MTQPFPHGVVDGPDSVTAVVLKAMSRTPDARLREVMESLVRHLHEFARETRLTEEEFERAVDFLVRLGQASGAEKNEVILACDLLAKAKADPGALNYGSAGNGSATHMNAEIFRQSARFEAQHIPYKGTPEAMTETATGRIDFFFAPLSSAIPLIKDGRLQALAIGTARRSPLLPDVPTTTEAGYAHSEYVFWVALLAPAGTPRAVVERLNAEALKALASAEVKEKLTVLGAEPMPMSPAAFDAFLRAETARMAQVVKDAGIKVQ